MLRLFDTRTQSPVDVTLGPTVRLYVCGITPYDSSHLGHAFTYTVFDVLVRHFEAHGHVVEYVRNVTDLDDDILRTARQRNVDFNVLSRTEAGAFDANLQRLGLRDPDVTPYVTETLGPIITMVSTLLSTGAAYQLDDGRVYFDTAADPSFLSFSHLGREEALRQFTEKGGDPDAPGKRDQLDFLLWQPSADDEPSFDTPWGLPGRPGWHIGCSAMANTHLGDTIDVHGGGSDLVFPHHEAETLQSQSFTGQAPFSQVWMHVGMVGLDGVKMSKSLGNLVFLGDLLDEFPPDAVRWMLLSHRYRDEWSYRHDDLVTAAGYASALSDAPDGDLNDDVFDQVTAALDDDLDTPTALVHITRAVADGNGSAARQAAHRLGFCHHRSGESPR